MKILDDLIATLNTDVSVRDIRQGVFYTAVLTRNCGLAATLSLDALRQGQPSVKEAGSLSGKEAAELIQLAYSSSILEAAIGMATINSLTAIDERYCSPLGAADFLAAKGRDKNLAIVGHFPFVPAVRQIAREVSVIEKNPRPGDFSEDEAVNILPHAEVVAITGTAFTNHTIEPLLRLCPKDAYIVVLGGTAPMSPVLFDWAIDAISGTKVVDPELALRSVSEGATYPKIKGVVKLTMTRSAD